MGRKLKIFLTVIAVQVMACASPTSVESNYTPPNDHTVNKDGILHKTGLHDPLQNCISCHGDDLQGGNVGVSCYGCHGVKW